MTIKGFVLKVNQIRYVHGIFRSVSRYLGDGGYCLLNNLRTVVRKNERDIYSRYFREVPREGILCIFIKLLNAVSFFRRTGSSGKEQSSYSALYIANNFDRVREFKLFDVVNGKVMVFFTDVSAKNAYLYWHNELHRSFCVPGIYEDEVDHENALVIELIEKLEGRKELDAIRSICSSHIHQLANSNNAYGEDDNDARTQPYRMSITSEAQDLINRLSNRISQDVLEQKYRSCMQHGDLSTDNLMYGKAHHKVAYWWIDWEHASERVFFYDVFFYILNNAVADRNFLPTQEFLAGLYDNELEQLFLAAGHNYSSDKRKEYFLRFALDFIKERLRGEHVRGAVDRYLNYFDEYFGQMA